MSPGVLAAVLASVIWGATPALIKRYASDVDPIAFNALRGIFSLPALAAISLAAGVEFPTSLYVFMLVFIASTVGPGIGDVAYIVAIRELGSGRAVTIGYTYIFVAQALAFAVLGEEVTAWLITGSALAMLGIWLVTGESGNGSKSLKGFAAACVSSLAWGAGTIVSKLALEFLDPLSLSLNRFIIYSLLFAPYAAKKAKTFTRTELCVGALTGLLSYGVGIPLYLYALDEVGVGVTVLVNALTPVCARLLSVRIAGEGLSARGVSGTIAVVAGIVLGAIPYLTP